MLEMMFALAGMFIFGALTGWIGDHLPEKLAEWMEIHTFGKRAQMSQSKKMTMFKMQSATAFIRI